MPARGIWRAGLLAAVLWCLGLWGWYGNAPLCHGRGDFASYPPSVFAWNHVRHGLGVTLGRQIRNLEDGPPEELVTYGNHPGVTVLLAAATFWLVGHPEPWAGRVFPALATLLAIAVLYRLARRCGGPGHAYAAATLFALFPITNLHGVNICYQPYMVLGFCCTLLCAQNGWHWRALLSVCLWGLVDFAALYPAPWLLLRALWRGGPWLPRLRYAACVGLTPVLVLGAHITFLLLTDGDLTGGTGRPLSDYILQTLRGGGAQAPEWGLFLAGQGRQLLESFSWPGVALAVIGLLAFARVATFAERVLLVTGVLEVLIFRAHAAWHEFWWQYLSPCMALAGGRLLAWGWQRGAAVRLLVLAALLGVAGHGGWLALRFWQQRDQPQVRRIADQLRRAADPREVVFLGFPPEGWSVEYFRQHPVGSSTFFLPKDFMEVLRRLGGDFLGLSRPIALWLPKDRVDAPLLSAIGERFPDARPQEVVAASPLGTDTWLRFDIGAYLRDPARCPLLRAARAPDPDLATFVAVSRRFQMLAALRPLESIAVRDGLDEIPQMHLRRGLFSHGATEFYTDWQLRGPLYAVAWPGTPQVDELRRLYPQAPRIPRVLRLPEGPQQLELIPLRP